MNWSHVVIWSHVTGSSISPTSPSWWFTVNIRANQEVSIPMKSKITLPTYNKTPCMWAKICCLEHGFPDSRNWALAQTDEISRKYLATVNKNVDCTPQDSIKFQKISMIRLQLETPLQHKRPMLPLCRDVPPQRCATRAEVSTGGSWVFTLRSCHLKADVHKIGPWHSYLFWAPIKFCRRYRHWKRKKLSKKPTRCVLDSLALACK